MGEEIFGPILPVLTYSSLDEAIRTVESHPHPLALYFFSEDKKAQKEVLDLCHFGDASTTPLSILLPVPCHLAVSVRAVWVDTTAWKAKRSVTLAALSTKKPGWIFRSGIRSMWDGKKNFYGCFCDSFLIFALPKLKSVKYWEKCGYVHCHVKQLNTPPFPYTSSALSVYLKKAFRELQKTCRIHSFVSYRSNLSHSSGAFPAFPGIKSSPSWTRTNDTAVNSRMLYRLSYGGSFSFSLFSPCTFKTAHT